MLRLFRFHAWYGKGEIDAEACALPPRRKTGCKTLSAERIAKELLRLLEAANPVPVLRVMAASGILSELLPVRCSCRGWSVWRRSMPTIFFPRDAILRLAALLPDGDIAAAHAAAER